MRTVRRMGRPGVAFALAAWFAAGEAHAQIDFSGEWRPLIHEDLGHRVDERAVAGPGAGTGAGGPRVGDYAGLPINDAARSRAESWDPRIWAAPEHQTITHPGAYWVHAPGGLRVSRVVDGAAGRVAGFRLYRVGGPESTTRTIWTDGRPHPPDYAAHTWQGFSTGRWNGETLIVETSHLKAGWVRRNGVPASDRATLTQHMFRHGDYLTIVNIVSDPVYLDEPYVTSGTWVLDPRLQIVEPPRSQIVEEIHGLRRAFVPHFLPGTNAQLKEFAARTGVPFEATRGGQDTMYPEYQRRLKASTAVRSSPAEP